MTKRRALLLLPAVIAAAAGAWVYSRQRESMPDPAPPPAPAVTKATTPNRVLNDQERMLVGTWKFDSLEPNLYAPGYQAVCTFAPDGSFTFSFKSDRVEHWSKSGTFRLSVDTLITDVDSGKTATARLEELTNDRLVISAPNGIDREVQQWSRVRGE